MTLYNGAAYLAEAMDSLLAQTHADFRLLLLDDASSDATEEMCRRYEARDRRVHYERHQTRRALIATWREVAEAALREHPTAEYFAWVSDHDRWHPEWLSRLLAELDAHPEAVLAYPLTQRISPNGEHIDKTPRRFDTRGLTSPRERWARFCADGAASGDVVYGLMRLDALDRAGIFRTVLRPDRLLVAEMSLHGEIRQVPAVLWFRRHFAETSISRQRQTLVLPEAAPRWWMFPPVVQHSLVLYREYAQADRPPLPVARREWIAMIVQYQLAYGSRHWRKSEPSHALERAAGRVALARKRAQQRCRHAVASTFAGLRACGRGLGRARRQAVYDVRVSRHSTVKEVRSTALAVAASVRRAGRRSLYHVLVFTHRVGWRGRRESRSHD
jgi:glycosyltransferase involved in cell wall biosynthesis